MIHQKSIARIWTIAQVILISLGAALIIPTLAQAQKDGDHVADFPSVEEISMGSVNEILVTTDVHTATTTVSDLFGLAEGFEIYAGSGATETLHTQQDWETNLDNIDVNDSVDTDFGDRSETCSDNDDCTVTIGASQSVTTTFALAPLEEYTLTGIVDDGISGISSALISATSSPTQTVDTTTGISGTYSMTLPADIYTVTASAYGYQSQTATNVEIISGTATVQDFTLTPVALYTVTGVITDANTGWPLYAEITIDGYPGDPIWTDPVTGYYTITLAEGITYTFDVATWLPGYQPASVSVGPLTDNTTVNFALDDNVGTCNAPGYTRSTSFFYDGFETGTITPTWMITTTNEGRVQASTSDPYMGSYSALLDDSVANSVFSIAGIILPIDLSGNTELVLDFWWREYGNQNHAEDGVFISDDDGVTWCQAFSFNNGPSSYTNTQIDLIAAANNCGMTLGTNSQILFQFYDDNPIATDGYTIDEVNLYNQASCLPPATGGLVVGNVYDDNTMTALNGATVVNENSYIMDTVETPFDPNVDDGFYTLFISATQDFTATISGGYQPSVENVAIVNGDTVKQDFFLEAGWLSASPNMFHVALEIGDSITLPLDLDNAGAASLYFDILETESFLSYDNGPLVTHPGGGADGLDASAVQNTSLGLDLLGFAHQFSSGKRIADDFVVDEAGYIDTITFFAYQTNSGPPSTITGVYLQIWDGPPNDPGSTVIFGDTTTNRLANTTFSNIYRVTETTLPSTNRPIMANTVDVGITLPPGTYWLDWMTDGSAGSGPWAPPISILGQTTTGNALQWIDSWSTLLDSGTNTAQGFPFIIDGYSGVVPWLSEDPITGTIGASVNTIIDITFNASVPEVDQPGDYLVTLLITNDTPYGTPTVPVTMTVIAPPTWGVLAGAVTGLGHCDADPSALADAEVLITGSGGMTYTTMTDATGYFSWWLDSANSPYTVDVTATEQETGSATGVFITGGITTTQDIDLRWLEPCVSANPSNLHVTLDLGATDSQTMTLYNDGALSTTFEIVEADSDFAPALRAAPSNPLGADGPDLFGYTYADSFEAQGPYFDWVDISATGTSVALDDDDSDGPFPIGFTFNFYGVDQTEFYIHSNGFLSFGSGSTSWENQCALPDTTTPNNIIPLMWDDLDPGDTADLVYYETFDSCPVGYGACLVVQYENFHHYPGGGAIAGTFEGIIFENGNVLIQFEDAGDNEGSGSTTGLENFDGTDGLGYSTCNVAGHLEDSLAVCYAYPGNPTSCQSGDIPWLVEEPITGTLDADGNLVIDVDFDANIPEVSQPGDYLATLNVTTDDPIHDTVAVPVTMTVNIPPTWGKLEGTVTGLGYCDADPLLYKDVEIFITDTNGISYTLLTDAAGYFNWWFDESLSPFDIVVTPPDADYTTDSANGVVVTTGNVTTQDFDLRWLQPCTSNDPEYFEKVSYLGDTLTDTLTLYNGGALSTTWELVEVVGDIPWLSEDPITGTLVADSMVEVDLSFDTSAPVITQTGWYSGVLMFKSDDPFNGNIDIPVDMVVVSGTLPDVTIGDDSVIITSPSTVVTHTFTVSNTGDMYDIYDLDISGNIWPTEVEMATTSFVAPGEFKEVDVYVTIPINPTGLNLIIGTDVFTFTAISQLVGNTISDAATGTTHADVTIGVDLSPASQAGTDYVHEVVTYTFMITNTGDFTDTFALDASGVWTATLSDASVELGAAESTIFELWVTVPGDADDGDLDTTTVTATSALDPTVSDTVLAMTTALRDYAGVILSADQTEADYVGEVVSYTFAITNTGDITDTFALDVSGVWTATLSETSVALGVGENAAFKLWVTVPKSAEEGDLDTITVTATSAFDPAISDIADAVTIALYHKIYMPLAIRSK